MNGNILNVLRKSFATIVAIIGLSCMATNVYANIPFGISQYTDEGIIKDFTDDYNIDIPVKYLAYESSSCSSSSYCVVCLESPSGTSYNITGDLGNPGYSDYTHYENVEADGYVYIDLQQKEAGEWRLKLVQGNAGNWYYTTNESDTPNPYTTQTIDGKVFLLNTENKEAKIQRGEYNIDGEFIIPETVTYEDNEYTVTAIGARCFYGCNSITNIVIPTTIKEIGNEAFYDCDGLTSITVPEGVTKIPNSCFDNCSNLASVTLPTTITELGNCIFDDCYNLKSLSIPDAVTRLGYGCFRWTGIETLTIPANVTSIGSDCFNSSNLKKLRMLPTTPPTCDGSLGLSSDATIYVDETAIETYKGIEPWSNYNIENPDEFPIGEAIVDELKYRLYPNNKAELIANDYNREGEFNIPSTFTYDGAEYTVTAIGAKCFYNCNSITNIVIPETIKEIGDYAFYDCDGLTSITIPEGVTKIPNRCFYNCSNLTSIALPTTITELGDYIFENCYNLKSLSIPEAVTRLGYGCFSWTGIETLTIPANVTSIGSGCFNSSNLKKLRMLTTTPPTCDGGLGLPSDATIYVDEAAIDTYQTTEPWSNYNIENPDGFPIGEATVGELKYRLYHNNKADLIANEYNREGEFNIPSSFTYNGNDYTVTAIGARCFYGCNSITNIVIPTTIKEIGNEAFYDCDGLTSITIPEGVTKIPNSCFNNCSNLASVTLPTTITELGNYIFDNCYNLKSLSIPDAVTRLGYGCFRWTGIETLTIPVNVTSIGIDCFYSSNLKKLRMLPTTPPTCDGGLGLPSDATIYVDETAIETYKGIEPWSNYNIENPDGFPIGEAIVDELKYRLYPNNIAELIANNYNREGEFNIPSSFTYNGNDYTVTAIGARCFYGCNSITNIVIPTTIKEIGNEAFYDCDGLTSITIPEGVTKIPNSCFNICI